MDTPMSMMRYLKKMRRGFYWFFFRTGSEQWKLNLSAFNPDDLLSTEGATLIQQKLDAWLAEQDNLN